MFGLSSSCARFLASLLLAVVAAIFIGTVSSAARNSAIALPTLPQGTQSAPAMAGKMAPHGDHNPKHGGLFFMSVDYHHHLEGKLVAPSLFYLWLYDAYTEPLTAEELAQAKGTVQWGSDEKAPKTPIRLAADGQRLVSIAPSPLNLPITLTLRLQFPGNPPGAKLELFTFPEARFSSDTDAGRGTTQPAPAATNSTDHSGDSHTAAPQGDKSADTLERHPAH